MKKIGSINSGSKGDVRSVRILAGAAVKSDDSICYFERLVNKLVVVVEYEDSNN